MNEVKKLVTFFSENLQNILRKYSRKNHEKNLRKNSQKKNLRKKSMKKFFKTKEVFDDKSQMEVFFLDFSYLQ